MSIIAHSFGTYALMRALKRTTLPLERIGLCGSVLPTSFRKADVQNLYADVQIVNECSANDPYPLLAKIGSWGYGPAGTWGLGTTGIRDRHHALGHSGYFKPDFVDKFWISFFRDGTVVDGPLDHHRPSIPWWKSIASHVPVRWLWFAPIVLAFFVVASLLSYKPTPGAPIPSVKLSHILGRPLVVSRIVLENRGTQVKKATVQAAYLVSPDGRSLILDVHSVFCLDGQQARPQSILSLKDLDVFPDGRDAYDVYWLVDGAAAVTEIAPAEKVCQGKDNGMPVACLSP